MKRILLVSALALSAMTAVGTWLAPAAYAAKTKTCTTTTDVTPPNGNAGFTQTSTNNQTSACNSASDTGATPTVTGCTTNKAGNCVSGH
jgi:hypothetical protein